MDPLHRTVARQIRRVARERQIRLTHLADRAGVGRTQLWALFRGDVSPTLAWLEKVSEALGVQVIELLQEEPARARREIRAGKDK